MPLQIADMAVERVGGTVVPKLWEIRRTGQMLWKGIQEHIFTPKYMYSVRVGVEHRHHEVHTC